MKTTTLLSAGFIALASLAQAQFFLPGTAGPNVPIFRKGMTGFGLAVAPTLNQVEIEVAATGDGLRLTQKNGSAGNVSIIMDNTVSGGGTWFLNAHNNNSSPAGAYLGIVGPSGNNAFLIDGGTDNVGINTTPATNTRFIVTDNSSTNSSAIIGEMTANSTLDRIGILGTSKTNGFNINFNVGVEGIGIATSGSSGSNYGVRGSASNSGGSNFGGYFEGGGSSLPTGVNIGVEGQLNSSGAGLNAAVYGDAAGFTGTSDWAGYFDGNVNINGQANCTSGIWTSSDQKLKKDITLISNSMDKIRQLKPSTYNFRTDEFKSMNLPKELQLGLIAQELESVFPNLVTNVTGYTKTDGKGNVTATVPDHKAVNYTGLIPVLIAAVQEQDKTIQAQQQQLDAQKNLIDQLTQKVSTSTGINAISGGTDGFALQQNEPNPFSHETTIKYTLPQSIGTAAMYVYDLSGKQITSYPINDRGTSSLSITSDKLAAGIYIYTVVADGKVMDSKRMIVADK